MLLKMGSYFQALSPYMESRGTKTQGSISQKCRVNYSSTGDFWEINEIHADQETRS